MNAKSSKRKVLIITYYWPPAGGPGVQRILKFVKYLPEFGWEPVILTVRDGEYPAIDAGLARDIPANLRVYATRSLEFFRLFKWVTGRKKDAVIETYILNRKKAGWKDRFFTWMRQNIFLPDARVGWVPFAVREGNNIIREEKPDLIFSSSPPHSLQLAAERLAAASGLPWVADLRDPWTDAFWDKGLGRSTWATQRNLKMEAQVVALATAITGVSHGLLELVFKGRHKPSLVLPNGYDAADFQGKKQPSDKFRIVYAGHMAAAQNPVNFFEALARLPEAIQSVLDIRFYGKFDQSVHQTIEQLGLGPKIQIFPYVPHSEAVHAITQADLLLLLIPREHGKGILTGKLFEYLATGNRILGIGEPGGEAARILESCKAGKMFAYEQDLLEVLTSFLREWKDGVKASADFTAIRQYDRRYLTSRLAGLFDELCS